MRDLLCELALRVRAAVQRQQVDLGVELVAVVDLAVEVDRHVRDEHGVAAKVDQLRRQPPALAHDRAPRDGQRPVEPRRHQHSAVALHVQPHIRARREVFGVRLELERRGIAMAGGDLEVARASLRHGKRHDRRAVARQKVAAAGRNRPRLLLLQLRKARRAQRFADRLAGVERRRRMANKFDKVFGVVFHLNFLPSRVLRNGAY